MLTCFKHQQLGYDNIREVYNLLGTGACASAETLYEVLKESNCQELADDIRQCRWDKFELVGACDEFPFYFDAFYPFDVSLSSSRKKSIVEVRRRPGATWNTFSADASIVSLAQTPEEVGDLLIIEAWISFTMERFLGAKVATKTAP